MFWILMPPSLCVCHSFFWFLNRKGVFAALSCAALKCAHATYEKMTECGQKQCDFSFLVTWDTSMEHPPTHGQWSSDHVNLLAFAKIELLRLGLTSNSFLLESAFKNCQIVPLVVSFCLPCQCFGIFFVPSCCTKHFSKGHSQKVGLIHTCSFKNDQKRSQTKEWQKKITPFAWF